eukprot:m51a1_g10809 hypothetical protein (446) ;mRNA; r:1585-7761
MFEPQPQATPAAAHVTRTLSAHSLDSAQAACGGPAAPASHPQPQPQTQPQPQPQTSQPRAQPQPQPQQKPSLAQAAAWMLAGAASIAHQICDQVVEFWPRMTCHSDETIRESVEDNMMPQTLYACTSAGAVSVFEYPLTDAFKKDMASRSAEYEAKIADQAALYEYQLQLEREKNAEMVEGKAAALLFEGCTTCRCSSGTSECNKERDAHRSRDRIIETAVAIPSLQERKWITRTPRIDPESSSGKDAIQGFTDRSQRSPNSGVSEDLPDPQHTDLITAPAEAPQLHYLKRMGRSLLPLEIQPGRVAQPSPSVEERHESRRAVLAALMRKLSEPTVRNQREPPHTKAATTTSRQRQEHQNKDSEKQAPKKHPRLCPCRVCSKARKEQMKTSQEATPDAEIEVPLPALVAAGAPEPEVIESRELHEDVKKVDRAEGRMPCGETYAK